MSKGKAKIVFTQNDLDQWEEEVAMAYTHRGRVLFERDVIPWLYERKLMRKDGLFDKAALQRFMVQDKFYVNGKRGRI